MRISAQILAALLVAISLTPSVVKADDMSFSIRYELRDQFIVGSGVEVTDGSSLFNVINFNLSDVNLGPLGTGWYANVWQGVNGTEFFEGDYSLGKVTAIGSVALDLSLNYYDIGRYGQFGDGDLFVPVIRADLPLIETSRFRLGAFAAGEYYAFVGPKPPGAADGITAYAGLEAAWQPIRRVPQLDLTLGGQYGYSTLDNLDRSFGKIWPGFTWSFSGQTRLAGQWIRFQNGDNNPDTWLLSVSHAF